MSCVAKEPSISVFCCSSSTACLPFLAATFGNLVRVASAVTLAYLLVLSMPLISSHAL